MPGMNSLGPRGFLTDEEKNNMPKVTKPLIKRILSYLKPYRLQFAIVFLTILLSSVVGLFPSLITGRIVDEALVGKNLSLLIKLLIAAFCTLMLSQLIGVAEYLLEHETMEGEVFNHYCETGEFIEPVHKTGPRDETIERPAKKIARFDEAPEIEAPAQETEAEDTPAQETEVKPEEVPEQEDNNTEE